MKKTIKSVSSLIFITFNKKARASGRLYIKYATDMDVSFDLSDSVKVTIRQKDRSCYVELSSETNRHFISSDVWLKIDLASKVEHSLDTAICIGYRKFAVRNSPVASLWYPEIVGTKRFFGGFVLVRYCRCQIQLLPVWQLWGESVICINSKWPPSK